MSRVTMLKVAQRAGVSQTTVSYVLNNRPNSAIPHETCERVRRAATELGYRPNAVARSLVRGQTYTLGFVIATLTNPFFAELTNALYHAARRRGYELLIALDSSSFEQEAQHLEQFIERRVDGILIWAGHARGQYPAAQRLAMHRTPYVVLGKRVYDEVTSYIDVDRPAAMEQAVEHLTRLGNTRIGYLSDDAGVPTSMGPASKYEGFVAALQRRGLAPAACIRCSYPGLTPANVRNAGYDAGVRLAAAAPLPQAVVCGGDLMALGLMAALGDHGVRVPEEVAVVGFDGIADGEFSRPRLTTVAQPVAQLVEHGLEAVLRLMAESDAPPQRETLAPRLVVRESCGVASATRDGRCASSRGPERL